ncbi:AhpD-like protein [Xylariaceae sp. FL1019]|nr:AhpD-like protein [Xylariaceae sp. FL1019]
MALARFPFDESPDPEARAVMTESLAKMHNGKPPFQYTDEDGQSLVGCYAPLCYSPTITRQFFALAKACYDPEAVDPRNREIAIMAFSSVISVPYVVYCHRPCADKVGLSDEQYDAGLQGNVPDGLTEKEQFVFQLGRTLATLTSRLDDETWQKATSTIGKAELVGITHIIAAYKWVALLAQVNGDDERWS